MSIVNFEDNYFDFNRKGAKFLISLTFLDRKGVTLSNG